jgi:phage gp46-like protein
VEKDETNLLKSYELKAVKMDIDIKEKNEPPTGILVEIENNNEEKGGVILVLDSPPPVIKIPLVKVEPPTSILVNINETPPATNENIAKITNEAVAESAVINKIPGKIVNKTIVKETPDKITNKVVVNVFPAKNGWDEQLNSESVVQPIGRDLGSPVQQLRRSKRLSEQINAAELAAELAAEPLLKQKKQVDKPISVEKPTSDSQDDAPAQIVILVTPESKPVRRSTRRISKVSTGYKRRSSRRSSHQPGYFRKPVTLKKIEVHLNDVGINEVVIDEVVIKPEPSATPELHKAVFLGSEHSSAESEDDAPKMFSSIPRSNIPHQRYGFSITICTVNVQGWVYIAPPARRGAGFLWGGA